MSELNSHSSDRLLVLLVLIVIVLSIAGLAQGNIIQVHPGDNIQMAISSAQPGDTIEVFSGLYKESILLNKSLVLRGIGSPVIDGLNNENAICIKENGTAIMNLTIINASVGINAISSNNNIISNSIEACRIGILLAGCLMTACDNNIINANKICTNAKRGMGIRLANSNNNQIKANNVSGGSWWGDGIYLISCKNNTIERNFAAGFGLWGDGICLESCNGCIIKGNIANGIDFCGMGIRLKSSERNFIERNTIDGNIVSHKGWRTGGISLASSDHNNISCNLLMNNRGSGIFLTSSKHNIIFGNVAYNNHPGAHLGGARNCAISSNTMMGPQDGACMVLYNPEECSITNNCANIDLVDSEECIVKDNAGWVRYSITLDP